MNAVEIANVSQWYGAIPVLQDLSLTLKGGEVLGLFGHNGAGKTTTIKLILGLLNASKGQIRVFDHPPQHREARRQLGYLPENVTFYNQLSGRETLRYFARLKGDSPARSDQFLEQVGLSGAADRRVKTYSKGMRQRLGLAQALLGSPRLLLLDEPTVGLDPIATEDLYQLIDLLRHEGVSVILCSHILLGVERHIDRAAILAAGRLQAIGNLTSLRRESGLPEKIRVSGIQDQEQWRQRWHNDGQQVTALANDCLEINVDNSNKLGILRQLLETAVATDIEIHQPSLADLYRFYMAKTPSHIGGAQP